MSVHARTGIRQISVVSEMESKNSERSTYTCLLPSLLVFSAGQTNEKKTPSTKNVLFGARNSIIDKCKAMAFDLASRQWTSCSPLAVRVMHAMAGINMIKWRKRIHGRIL